MRWWIPLSKICKFFGLYYMIMDREGNEPYLHRYYLLNTRWIAWLFPKLSYRLVLHNCVKSDVDGLHDHPWDWGSKILDGGYYETMPSGERIWRSPRDGWRFFTAHDFHRLELPHEGAECWSLFLMGPKDMKEYNTPWGFKDRDGNWVHWREYIDNRDAYS